MGIFSNPCINPDCDARVKKSAHFCAKCGAGGPDSLTKCADCGKKVGRAFPYCWNCGAQLATNRPPRIAGNRWVRDDEEFAVRVYPDDLEQKWLARRITVEAGTLGILEKNGRVVRDVPWGKETLDGILQLTGPTSIILVNAGDAVLRPTFHRLHDVNGAELDLTVQLVLRVSNFEAFVREFFEGHKRRVTFRMLEDRLAHELFDVTRGLVCSYALEDMYGNLAWRDEFEEKLRTAMTVTFDRYGLDLLQLNFADFGGDHFEQLMQDRGEVYMGNRAADQLAEKLAIRKRMGQLEARGELDELAQGNELTLEKLKQNTALTEEMGRIKTDSHVRTTLSEAERDETIEQALQELEIKRRLRRFEVEDIDRERDHLLKDEDDARTQELEKIDVEHQNEVAMTVLMARNSRLATDEDFRREQARLENAQALEEAWKQSEQHRQDQRADAVQRYDLVIQESKANLEVARHQTQERLDKLQADRAEAELGRENMEHKVAMLTRMQEQERQNMEAMRRLDIEEKKLEFDYKRFDKEKDTEVQLASIQGNVQIATAQERLDAATAQATMQQLQERLADQQADKEALRGDANQRAQDLKDMAGTLTANQPQPVVVGGGAPMAGAGQAAKTDEFACPNCNRPVPLNYPNCPWCKHEIAK